MLFKSTHMVLRTILVDKSIMSERDWTLVSRVNVNKIRSRINLHSTILYFKPLEVLFKLVSGVFKWITNLKVDDSSTYSWFSKMTCPKIKLLAAKNLIFKMERDRLDDWDLNWGTTDDAKVSSIFIPIKFPCLESRYYQ